jgi:hypothetical protein
MHLPTARDIWKALSKAFYDGTDELQLFALNKKAFSTKQRGRTLSVYYGELTEIFSELDHRDKVIIESEKDVESYRKLVQRQRVHIFLTRLDDDFEQIHGEILRKEPVPKLKECYALIRRESIRRTMMNGEIEHFKTSAMVAQNRSGKHQYERIRYNHQKNGAYKSAYKCSHYYQNGHTKSKCFELVGYPDWWDHNRDPRKKNAKMTNPTAAIVKTHSEINTAGKLHMTAVSFLMFLHLFLIAHG